MEIYSKLLLKAIDNQKIEDSDIEEELYEICEREHSSCNQNCPCYYLKNEGECEFFKSGKKMLKVIRKVRSLRGM